MNAEHLKGWFDKIQHKEKAARENPGRTLAGKEQTRGLIASVFLELIQTIWEHGEISEQMSWMVFALLAKGGDNFRGIGLLDPCWEVEEKIMVCRLAAIEFHPCLHGGLHK